MEITGLFTEAFWYVSAILASLTITITGAINQKFNIQGDMITGVMSWKQFVSWMVALAITLGSYFIGWTPEIGHPVWLSLICQYFVVMAVANWGYDIEFIKNWISQWFVKK